MGRGMEATSDERLMFWQFLRRNVARILRCSVRIVAEKIGMTLEKRTSVHQFPVHIYSVANAVTRTS